MQVFVLGASGKPIYSRHGDETQLSSVMGIIQALMSHYIDNNDHLRTIESKEGRIVFMDQSPLYLVGVGKTSAELMTKQLQMVYNQMLFHLTKGQIERIFKRTSNFDLRRLLQGTEQQMDLLIDRFELQLLPSNPIARMPTKQRQTIQKLFQDYPQELLFGVLIGDRRIIHSISTRSNLSLHPSDLHLIINLVYSSESFKAVESWTPVCCPHLDPNGFLYCHISFLGPDLCLCLLSPQSDAFFSLSKFKASLLEQLQPEMSSLERAIETRFNIVEVGIPGLRHFYFEHKGTHLEADPLAPYTSNKELKRLFALYDQLYQTLKRRPLQGDLGFQVTESETIVCDIRERYTVFAAFNPFALKESVAHSLRSLVRWIKSQNAFTALSN
ncbi:vacuolar fusion protein MON1 [Gorgonomyces haynaldii]|nr:vacuolar fusion protein MON1 [Gorgonomyces haynaldii]